MRKINTQKFQRATRGTSRKINRQIVLNLIRERQPISRADLARLMKVRRATVGPLVSALLTEGAICEEEPAPREPGAPQRRGRPPRLLRVRTRDRLVIAIDIRFGRTQVQLSDLSGEQIALATLPTPREPAVLAERLAEQVQELLRTHGGIGECEGIGLVVPGMVDRRTGAIQNSPALGWKNVQLREMLADRVGMLVLIENAPHASALARMWHQPEGEASVDSFAYVSVTDGVGVGIVSEGQLLRGHNDTAGEFGHLPVDVDGPRCLCGLRGCLEAHTSNLYTLGRYLGLDPSQPEDRERLRDSGLTVPALVELAREGDARAHDALAETGRWLGVGLGLILLALNPGRIYVDGELVTGWDLIGPIVERSARERMLTDATRATPIVPVLGGSATRLRGATALLLARKFRAPAVA